MPQLSPIFWGLFPVVVFFILVGVVGVMDDSKNINMLIILEEEKLKFNSMW